MRAPAEVRNGGGPGMPAHLMFQNHLKNCWLQGGGDGRSIQLCSGDKFGKGERGHNV